MSKAHPNMQSNYTKKMLIYNARTEQREKLVLAKEWFERNTGLCARDHRVLITNIKKSLLKGEEPDVASIRRKLKLTK